LFFFFATRLTARTSGKGTPASVEQLTFEHNNTNSTNQTY